MKFTKPRAGIFLIGALVILAKDLFATSKSVMDGIALSILAIASLYFFIASLAVRKKEPDIYNAEYTFIALICFAASVVLLIFYLKSLNL